MRVVLKDLLNLGQKGIRELRGLVSTVNYDGSSSRFRGLSNSLGVIGSFK